MDLFNFFEIALELGIDFCLNWIWHEEGIMGISCGMMLWLEKSVEIPKTIFNVPVGSHLFETHLYENFLELLSSFHEQMQISISDF